MSLSQRLRNHFKRETYFSIDAEKLETDLQASRREASNVKTELDAMIKNHDAAAAYNKELRAEIARLRKDKKR